MLKPINILLILVLILSPTLQLYGQTPFVPPQGSSRGLNEAQNLPAQPIVPVVNSIKSPQPPQPPQQPSQSLPQAQPIQQAQPTQANQANNINQPAPRVAINDYGKLTRQSGNLQIQKAWDEAKQNEGIYIYDSCENCTYKVATREFFITTIQLPANEVIETIDIGDNSSFQIKQRTSNAIAIKPLIPGVDTNIIIWTNANIYPLYIRSEGIDSPNIPDMVVKIIPDKFPNVKIGKLAQKLENKTDIKADIPIEKPVINSVKPTQRKYPQELQFDPSKLRGWGDYELAGDKELKPLSVFRDDYFTYINFGSKFNEIDLPVAYVVNDGIDENVNTRVNGTTLIIESVAKKITLVSGKKYICITYEGK